MKNRFQRTVDYIEENLTTEISANELSQMAGYSNYHFQRLFHNAIGIPVMQYILQRRLLHAIYEIDGGKKRVETIMKYGFDTYAGFYKAFNRNFHCTPSEYLKKNRAKKPAKPDLLKEEFMQISHKKIETLLKNWGMESEEISDIYYDNNGNKNDHACYIGSEYVLKFTKRPGEIRVHKALTEQMDEAGIRAALILPARDGFDYVQDDDVFFYMNRRLKGKQLNAAEMYEGDYAQRVGHMIGKLHLVLQNTDAVVKESDFYATVTGWACETKAVQNTLGKGFIDDYRERFAKLYPQLAAHCIHRDLNPGNIIADRDGWGMVDFELTERNIRIWDPCYAATAVLSETYQKDDNERWFEVFGNILKGYDSVIGITDAEKEALPLVVLGNQMICLAYFATDERFETIFRTNVSMTKWLAKNMDKLKI